eukprot:gene7667-9434_t
MVVESIGVSLDPTEKTVLQQLYTNWDGPNWKRFKGWRDNSIDPCEWEGITCTAINNIGHVSIIELKDNGLSGEFGSTIKQLKYLEKIDLSFNSLNGSIPIDVFQDMTKLFDITLNYNELSGDLSWTNHLPTSIVTLWIAYNSFSGNIPTTYSKYINLDLLFLEENLLHGLIPPELGDIPNIRLLDIGFNSIHGDIPSNLGKLSKLEYFWAYDNGITNSIPESFSNLKNLKLIEVTRNTMSGSIPNIFSNMPNITSIRFAGNKFSGSLDWVCQLKNTIEILIDDNSFELLPDCKDSFPISLNNFVVSSNQLIGTIPESMGNWINLKYIKLSNNKLTGCIPTSFSRFQNLSRIDVSENHIECSLFEFLNPIRFHRYISIIVASGNKLHGEFIEDMFWDGDTQQELFNSLFIMNFARNNLSGPLPEYLSWMPNLNDLDLSYNNFEGPIPNALNYLRSLYLENNHLYSYDGGLPEFMKAGQNRITLPDENFSCPSIVGKYSEIRITLDTSYYNHSLCYCNEGYRGINGTCFKCPEFSICKGGDSILIPSGYYPVPSFSEPEALLKCGVSNFGFTSCNPDNEPVYTCKSGYEDRLCSKCKSGHFSRGTECLKCPTGPESIAIFIIVVIVFILLFLFFVLTDPKRSLPSSTRKTIIYYYQVFNLLLSKLSPWPSFFNFYYSGSSWINFSFGFLCIGDMSQWPNLFIVMLILPIAFVIITALFILSVYIFMLIRSGGNNFQLNKKWFRAGVRVNLLALNFLYLPLCIYIFQNYTCKVDSYSGESFMSFFPWIKCKNNSYYDKIFALTILGTIFYVIGIPVLFAALLYYYRRRLEDSKVLLLVGSIYIDYRKSVFWYELIAVARRLLMAVSLALIDPKSSFSVFVVLLVIGASIISQINFRPFIYKISNTAELLGNSVLLFSYVCVLILSSLGSNRPYDSKGIEIILSSVVVIYTAFLAVLFIFSLKYFLPKKMQAAIDQKILKILQDIKGWRREKETHISIEEEETGFETNSEPLFQKTTSMVTGIELKRRITQLSQYPFTPNSPAPEKSEPNSIALKPFFSAPNLSTHEESKEFYRDLINSKDSNNNNNNNMENNLENNNDEINIEIDNENNNNNNNNSNSDQDSGSSINEDNNNNNNNEENTKTKEESKFDEININ